MAIFYNYTFRNKKVIETIFTDIILLFMFSNYLKKKKTKHNDTKFISNAFIKKKLSFRFIPVPFGSKSRAPSEL